MLREQLQELALVCDEDERDLLEKTVFAAADYVAMVTRMETIKQNLAGRTGDELRTAVERADRERRNCHNALISLVDIANRICAAHDRPLIYTGDSLRRHYGDFALALTAEIFEARG